MRCTKMFKGHFHYLTITTEALKLNNMRKWNTSIAVYQHTGHEQTNSVNAWQWWLDAHYNMQQAVVHFSVLVQFLFMNPPTCTLIHFTAIFHHQYLCNWLPRKTRVRNDVYVLSAMLKSTYSLTHDGHFPGFLDLADVSRKTFVNCQLVFSQLTVSKQWRHTFYLRNNSANSAQMLMKQIAKLATSISMHIHTMHTILLLYSNHR